MGRLIQQLWDWIIPILQQAIAGLFADMDALIPPAPDIQHTPVYVAPFLTLLTRFVALDWLFYYAMILIALYGLVWGWRAVVHLWELIPFN